jgi:hypothetical protein
VGGRVCLDHLGLADREDPARFLTADHLGHGGVDDVHPVHGQPSREPSHLARQPDGAGQLQRATPHLREPVRQVQDVTQIAFARRVTHLPGRRQLPDRELAHAGRALTSGMDQPVLGPHPTTGAGVAARVGRVDLSPRRQDAEVVDLCLASANDGALGQIEQRSGRQLGQIVAGGVEPEQGMPAFHSNRCSISRPLGMGCPNGAAWSDGTVG